MSDMTNRIFETTDFGKAALAKLGPVPENFRLYDAGWLGNGAERHVMRVVGAEFRKAKTGKNAGKLSIKIKGSEREVYVTAAEMRSAPAMWTCCGGVLLSPDEKCAICGEGYDD